MDYNHSIPVEDVKYVSLASFLAGALLMNKEIHILDFSRLSAEFGIMNDVYFLDTDFYKINDLVYTYKGNFELIAGFQDVVVYDGVEYTVYDYLYSLTDSKIRKFFDIPEVEKQDIIKCTTRKKIKVNEMNKNQGRTE